jgi:two-component system, cell cycle sensor histidine kinase and response regulator CckA
MPNDLSSRIAREISVLYEISLSIGKSLDIESSCAHFLRTILARKNLAYASVWIRARYMRGLNDVSISSQDADSLSLVYAIPQFRVRERSLPAGHPLLTMFGNRDAMSICSDQKEFAAAVTEKHIEKGVFALFKLGNIGVLKLFSITRDEPFGEEYLNQLRHVVSKFAVSLQGCLDHASLIREMGDRRKVEEALRQGEEKYRNVVERASDGILILQDGKITYTNASLRNMTRQKGDEIIGLPFNQFVHPSELARVGEYYRRRMAGESAPQVYETVLVTQDGETINVELNAGVTTYEGRPADLVFIRDITKRKTSDAERAQLVMAVEQTTDAVVITDMQGNIQYANPAFERITGFSRAEVVGKNPRFLKSGRQESTVYTAMWAALTQGHSWRGRFQNKKKDGSIFTCDTVITPTREERGTIINYVSVQRDVTRELQMEEQYLQAQKMESIGRLAGGIAHDFNNIMTAILGFGSMILDQLGENHPLRHAVEQIVSAGERATNLTRQLLTFSRKQMVEVRILDPNAVIVEMNQLLRRALGEDIELLTLLDDEAGCVKMDAGLLQQVVMNLAINARDAMARGGQLTIRTAHAMLDEKFCRTRVNVQPGDYLQLSVRDSGAGMTREVLNHVFEPFFTTKPKGKGTGLGLATVYGIVSQCGGHIEIDSEPGAGTEVRIWLPRVVTSADTVPVELEDKLQKGTETILVVEDEEVVRDLSCRILRSLGYHVVEAANGKEALELVRKYSNTIHLVFTDVVMPQMGGPEMVENLVQMRPGIKVIYTSGFTESTIVERGVALGKVRLIQKPFTRELLAQRIRHALDEG